MKKVMIVLSLVALAALIGLVGWRVYQKLSAAEAANGRRSAPVPVEVTQPARVTMRDVGRYTGGLVADSQFVISPRVSGRLDKLLVDLGSPVRRDQLIAVLDDMEYIQQAERARAEEAVAEAKLLEAGSSREAVQREFERVAELVRQKINSPSDYDQAKAQFEVQDARYQVAQAQVEQANAALREAEIRLGYTKISAVWEGGSDQRIVGQRFIQQGALLAANDPIVSILDIDPLIAVINVIERDYSKIAPGQEAILTADAYPGRRFTGRVLRIAPQLQETSRQARVEVRVPNSGRLLRPGMSVQVELEFARHRDVTAVPVAGEARRGGRTGVFVVDPAGDTVRFVPLELGIINGPLVEVLRPALNRPVVVLGQHLLQDGSKIDIRATQPAPSLPTTQPDESVGPPAASRPATAPEDRP
ncbi:MAG: Macrolide export protein MacA [Phycisphaerae bacterium]|nr:Macrolide export protein MacA [Phycisphaerae bacterium]